MLSKIPDALGAFNNWQLLLLTKIRYLAQQYSGKAQGSTGSCFPFQVII